MLVGPFQSEVTQTEVTQIEVTQIEATQLEVTQMVSPMLLLNTTGAYPSVHWPGGRKHHGQAANPHQGVNQPTSHHSWPS